MARTSHCIAPALPQTGSGGLDAPGVPQTRTVTSRQRGQRLISMLQLPVGENKLVLCSSAARHLWSHLQHRKPRTPDASSDEFLRMVTTIRTSLLRHFGHCGNDGITCLLLAQWICWRLLFPYLIPVNQGGLTAEPWEFRSLSMNWTQKREGCVVGAGFDPGWSTDPGSGSRRLLRELPGYPGYVRRGANQKVADVVPFRFASGGRGFCSRLRR